MPELLLVRHAEARHNLQSGVLTGREPIDSRLSSAGVQQARWLGRYWAEQGMSPRPLHVSPTERTRKTAEYAMRVMGWKKPPARIVEVEELHELHVGEWDGKLYDDIYTPEVREQMAKEDKHFVFPGGESTHQAARRLLGWAEETFAASPDDSPLLAVTHGIVAMCAKLEVTGWEETARADRRVPGNTGITSLAYDDGQWQLQYYDRRPPAYIDEIG